MIFFCIRTSAFVDDLIVDLTGQAIVVVLDVDQPVGLVLALGDGLFHLPLKVGTPQS